MVSSIVSNIIVYSDLQSASVKGGSKSASVMSSAFIFSDESSLLAFGIVNILINRLIHSVVKSIICPYRRHGIESNALVSDIIIFED